MSSGRRNHLQVFIPFETKTCENQLFKHDLKRQNIIG
jgi:hypothetical protein